MQYLSKKDSYNRNCSENLSEFVDDWRIRFDQVVLSIIPPKTYSLSRSRNRSPNWWLDCNLDKLFNSIKKLDRFNVRDYRSPNILYRRLKTFTSDDHLVEFFYDREFSSRPEISVIGSIRVTVRNKTPKAYVEHCKLILSIEKMIMTGWSHISLIEMCLDCLSSQQEFERISNLVLLKFSRLKEIFNYNGTKNISGELLKIPGHATTGTNYINTRVLSKQLKTYVINEEDITSNISLVRRRIELSFKRPFLRRKKLNTFSQILTVGPDLFFSQIEFVEFSKSRILKLRTKSFDKKINEILCKMSAGRLDNLLKKPSTEIVKRLSTLIPWPTSRIKTNLGTKIEIPFVFDS